MFRITEDLSSGNVLSCTLTWTYFMSTHTIEPFL